MDFGSLSVSIVRLIDRACDEFETDWRNGGRPRIEAYLRDLHEPGRSALLSALLATELEARRRLGELPAREEYLARFPNHSEVIRGAYGDEPTTVTLEKNPARVPSPVPPVAAPGDRGGAFSPAMVGSLLGTGRALGKRIWIYPLIAAAVLAITGYGVRATIERVMSDLTASKLLALRDADVEALELSFGTHEAVASIAASDSRVRDAVRHILDRGERDTASLLRAPELADLRTVLGPWLGQYEYDGFRVLDRQGRSIASWRDETVGGSAGREEIEAIEAVFAGQATVSRPRPSEVMLPDVDGKNRLGLPTMFVLAPIHGKSGETMAALAFRMRPDRTFTRVLNVARFGRTGETYAFDRTGLLLSESRFDDDLRRIGLIPDTPYSRSTLSLELRDPGVDMTTGARPKRPRREQPLTREVAETLEGGTGVDVEGDRDYRGVAVIGAWKWLPKYSLGVVTKVDRAEAYRPLAILQTAFWGLFALLAAAAIALFGSSVVVARLRGRVRAASLVAQQLGRYTLDEKIGEGGMGVVYRARHAMLRRPTAVKLLIPEKTNEKSIARFEREVQLTSRLTHPNTITIYDYGRTSEGIFYYAMEYLDGIDLQLLVTRHGAQPEGRVIHILSQVCGSLIEAHEIGLIHRDIKPSNIILTRRGGLCDFAKLVDFGLVKADDDDAAELTSIDAIVGTPRYMAPETIQFPDKADARSDLYSVGALGYYLLTGRPPFEGRSLAELLFQHISGAIEPPTARRGEPVSPELETLLLRCLAKDPAQRPQDARSMVEALAQIATSDWSAAAAESWWHTHVCFRPS